MRRSTMALQTGAYRLLPGCLVAWWCPPRLVAMLAGASPAGAPPGAILVAPPVASVRLCGCRGRFRWVSRSSWVLPEVSPVMGLCGL